MIPHDSARSQFTVLHHRAASVFGGPCWETLPLNQECVRSSSERRQQRGSHKRPVPTIAATDFPAERSAGLTAVHVFACAGGVRPILKNVCIVDDIPAACKET